MPGRILVPALLGLFSLTAARAHGEPGQVVEEVNHWRVAVSPYTHHFRFSAEHRPVWALVLERHRFDHWLVGASFFKNSFGQPSGYLYLGRGYHGLVGHEQLYLQWTAGLIYGYTGKYKTKVPLNFGGFSPGVVPSIGWQYNHHTSAQLNMLGDAGVMLQLSHDFH